MSNLGQGKVVRGQFTRGKDLVKSKQECLIKITIYCLQFELYNPSIFFNFLKNCKRDRKYKDNHITFNFICY